MVRNGKEQKTAIFLRWLQLLEKAIYVFAERIIRNAEVCATRCRLAELLLGFRVANLWPEFPAHDVHPTGADGTECKTLRNLWWLQLLKRQKLTFLPNP